MPPRRRPRVATSSNANEGDIVRGLVDSIGDMLRGDLDRVQHPRFVRKRDVSDARAVEFKGAKGPLDANSWVDKMERAFESTKLPEEKKVKMAVSFLDDSAHHWWTLGRRNNDIAQTMTWEQFKALFLDEAEARRGDLTKQSMRRRSGRRRRRSRAERQFDQTKDEALISKVFIWAILD
ncbi:hypothetical protein ACLB2K_077625 [Fragaria x ananassa]